MLPGGVPGSGGQTGSTNNPGGTTTGDATNPSQTAGAAGLLASAPGSFAAALLAVAGAAVLL